MQGGAIYRKVVKRLFTPAARNARDPKQRDRNWSGTGRLKAEKAERWRAERCLAQRGKNALKEAKEEPWEGYHRQEKLFNTI